MRFYKYCDLVNANTNYANRMKMLSNRIFGDVVRPTNEKSMRVPNLFLKRFLSIYIIIFIFLKYLGSKDV